MISTIVSKELRQFLRSGVYISVAAAFMVLLAAAATLSLQRTSAFERERLAAEAVDRDAWDSQGERNPHSAAHFSRYAFKPISAFTAFDSGVTDYAGIAIWLEAHFQNPAVFRRAEDLGDTARMANFSPAWVLQIATPLFIFLTLYGAIAGEREGGTLRQTAAAGVRANVFLAGKLLGAGVSLGVILVPALILSLLAAAAAGSAPILPDPGVRFIGLALAYFAYFAAIGAIAVGISALCSEKRLALIVLAGVWAASFVLAPRLAAAYALAAYAEPDAAQLEQELQTASDAYDFDTGYQESEQRRLLAEYGVETVEDLPIDFRGFTLQSSEEYAHPHFEAFFRRLDDLHTKQERVLAAASLLSPALALNRLSAGLAGADREHQKAFAAAAEEHRRSIIKELNGDLMRNGAAAGRSYAAGPELWRQIENFAYTPPHFMSFRTHYAVSVGVLLAYLAGGFGFAAWAVGRAQKRIAR